HGVAIAAGKSGFDREQAADRIAGDDGGIFDADGLREIAVVVHPQFPFGARTAVAFESLVVQDRADFFAVIDGLDGRKQEHRGDRRKKESFHLGRTVSDGCGRYNKRTVQRVASLFPRNRAVDRRRFAIATVLELVHDGGMIVRKALLVLALAVGLSRAEEQKQPNIVFIFTDDHCEQALSAYDATRMSTPNLDRIAKEGMKFTRCYVTNSICGPSR